MKCLFLSLKEIAVLLARISLIGLTTASYAGAPLAMIPYPLNTSNGKLLFFLVWIKTMIFF